MLKVGNAHGLWHHVYIVLPPIHICPETTIRMIWWLVGNNAIQPSNLLYLSSPVRHNTETINFKHLKMTVFWDIAPCNLVETDRRFRGANYSKHFWNVGQFLPD
jgi:hypothetical protein